MPHGTFPGMVKSKNYKKLRKKLDKLFQKYKKDKIIFVTHNVPYKTKFSKINSKEAPKDVQRVEKGSKLVRRIINRYNPLLNITGHMHEYQGTQKLGKTILIATGAAQDGKAAIINFDENKQKIKSVKFIK